MNCILVVEDNPLNLRLLETILDANGFNYGSAVTGEQGVEMAADQNYDLILMDLQLPGIDGYEALSQIRQSTPQNETPIIAVTGNTTISDQERALEAGFNDFLKKPYRIDDLLAMINRNLRGHRLTDSD